MLRQAQREGVKGEDTLTFILNLDSGLLPELDVFANGLRVNVEL